MLQMGGLLVQRLSEYGSTVWSRINESKEVNSHAVGNVSFVYQVPRDRLKMYTGEVERHSGLKHRAGAVQCWHGRQRGVTQPLLCTTRHDAPQVPVQPGASWFEGTQPWFKL